MKLVWSSNLFTQGMMGLIATSDHRAQLSALAAGGSNKVKRKFPLLISPSGSLCREAFDYLYDLSILGPSESEKTLRTYAESLCHWLSYAERSDINWRRPTKRHFARYRNSMKGQPTDDELRAPNLKPRTINLRLTVAMEFSKFLGQEQPKNSDEPEQSTDCKARSAEDRSKPIKRQTILVKVSKDRPRALTIEAIGAQLNALGLPHRLAFQWQLCTGLRRGSVTALSLQHIDELTSPYSDGYVSVPAKGGKLASAYVPQSLLTETIRYIETQRTLVEPRNHVPLRRARDQQALFLNSRGNTLTGECYYKAFKRAAKRIGLNAKTHQARSTFATHMETRLRQRRAAGMEIDPIKIVQGLLGHSSSSTTEDYLESITCTRPDILQIIDDWSDSMTGGDDV